MKYVFLAIVSMMSVMTVNAKPSDSLINAIIKVESNDNVNAIGDNGKAVGCMQIWKVVVDDVNKVSKFGPSRSIIIKFLSENDKNK